MLPRSAINPSQVDTCRTVFAEMASSWAAVSAASADGARRRAEEQVFGQMVVALAGWIEPLVAAEGLAMNPAAKAVGVNAPLQELHLLAHGIASQQGRFPADKAHLWRAEQSITGHQPGDRIAMTASGFSQLCDACLNSIAG